jgi:hypothetical protein
MCSDAAVVLSKVKFTKGDIEYIGAKTLVKETISSNHFYRFTKAIRNATS